MPPPYASRHSRARGVFGKAARWTKGFFIVTGAGDVETARACDF